MRMMMMILIIMTNIQDMPFSCPSPFGTQKRTERVEG
jgi:hypothetical protein